MVGKITIQPDPIDFYNGGQITGQILIESPDIFSFDVLHLLLRTVENVKFIDKSGKVFTNKATLLKLDTVLGRDQLVNKGITRVPFSIDIPYETPSSFEGHLGNCVYTLHVRMVKDISKVKTASREIQVRSNISIRNPNPIHIVQHSAEVQFEKDLFCIGEHIDFKFKLLEDLRLSSLDIELHRIETAVSDYLEGTWSRRISKMAAELDGLDILKGINVEFDTYTLQLHSYEGKNLNHRISLHLKLGFFLGSDKTIVVPLTLVQCPTQSRHTARRDQQ